MCLPYKYYVYKIIQISIPIQINRCNIMTMTIFIDHKTKHILVSQFIELKLSWVGMILSKTIGSRKFSKI